MLTFDISEKFKVTEVQIHTNHAIWASTAFLELLLSQDMFFLNDTFFFLPIPQP